jgi:sec-independent protein translocase protein TatC
MSTTPDESKNTALAPGWDEETTPPPTTAVATLTPPNGTALATSSAHEIDDVEEEEGMTMLEHLEELRIRIIICSVALAAGLAVSALPIPYLFHGDPDRASVTQFVQSVLVLPAAGKLQYLEPGEGFIAYFQVALTLSLVFAMPVIIWQGMAFVLPALHAHEKKYLYMALPGALGSFCVGVAFGYMLVLPTAIGFLINFNTDAIGVEAKWQYLKYIETITMLLLWMGLSFETPLLMFFLTKLRVLNPQRMAGFRRYAIVLAFIVGAMITPTPDPLNQTLVSLPIYLLFEVGIQVSKLA